MTPRLYYRGHEDPRCEVVMVAHDAPAYDLRYHGKGTHVQVRYVHRGSPHTWTVPTRDLTVSV